MNKNPRQLSPSQLTKQIVHDLPVGHILFIPPKRMTENGMKQEHPYLYKMSEQQRIRAGRGGYGGPRLITDQVGMIEKDDLSNVIKTR